MINQWNVKMDFEFIVSQFPRKDDFLINPNCDPLISSIFISKSHDELKPLFIGIELPLDDVNYEPSHDIEGPYDSLLAELNPVDLPDDNTDKQIISIEDTQLINDDDDDDDDFINNECEDNYSYNDEDDDNDETQEENNDDEEVEMNNKEKTCSVTKFQNTLEKENQAPNSEIKQVYKINQIIISGIINTVPTLDNFDNQQLTTPQPTETVVDNNQSNQVNCCRKHIKYYRKLMIQSNRKTERTTKDKPLIVNFLFTPLDGRNYLKPKFSHNMLCAFAIVSAISDGHMMEVSGIYKFLCKCFPYFETAELHWKNSLRHSLTTCNWFAKTTVHRTAKKGYKWTINWENTTCLAWEISKQCIKDITKLYHCLSCPEVCEYLMKAGLLELDQPRTSLIRQSYR